MGGALIEVSGQKLSKAELLKNIEEGLIPDDELRRLMRGELAKRIQWGYKPTHEQQVAQAINFAHSLRKMKIANEAETLVEEVYEMPMSFLRLMLGPTLKLSCLYFKNESTTLEQAEIDTMDMYCKRAGIQDGMSILDLGCGQGSLTLHIAHKYKNCRITALTNSASQKGNIEDQCKLQNLPHVKVILADIANFDMDETFDRVMVIELFEHMKNYALLLKKMAKWLSSDGLLFVDTLCQKTFPYHFDPIDEDDWYTNLLFTPGTSILPSASFLLYFQDDVSIANHWTISGKHFSRTNEEWLKRIDGQVNEIRAVLKSFLGTEKGVEKLINYWRGFCLSGMEMFGYDNGEEWMTAHYLFRKK